MGTETKINVPDIGDFKDVEVIEVLATPGTRITTGVPLITLESDKATMEVPSPCSGIVREIAVKIGDRLSQGSPILTLEEMGDDPDPVPAERHPASVGTHLPPHASPSVRRLGRELDVKISDLAPSGPKGRILHQDVEGAARGGGQEYVSPSSAVPSHPSPDMPVVDFARFGPVKIRPLTRIQKLSGANLHQTWVNIPHVTQHDLADITDLEAFRQSLRAEGEGRGVRITMLAFLLKASVAALKIYPNFNASLAPDGENLVLKNYYHIGVAVDTTSGLVVPVIRDVDQKNIFQLAEELAAISAKARGKGLTPGDMQGGSFTISSLGGIGGVGFTPIINAPEVAILGVARATLQPVYYPDGTFQPRRMLPLSLSYDHRVIDGADGARFTTQLGALLTDIRRLLLQRQMQKSDCVS